MFSDGKSERARLLTDECQECIAVGNEVLQNTIQQLLNGHISVAKLKLLTAGTANFLGVFRVVEKNAESDVFNVPESGVQDMDKAAVLQKVIIWRQKEQQNLELICRLVSYFVTACDGIQSGRLWIALKRHMCKIYVRANMKHTLFQNAHHFRCCDKII